MHPQTHAPPRRSRRIKATAPPTSHPTTRARFRRQRGRQSSATVAQEASKGMESGVDGPQEHLACVQMHSLAFRFLDLPVELRLQIYRLCLTRPDKLLLSKFDQPSSCHKRPGGEGTADASLAGGSIALAPASDATTSRSNGPPRISHRPIAEPKPSPKIPRRSGRSLNVALLATCKQIYKEARDVMYSENVFDIDIYTAVASLAALHQRSRRHIQHIELDIPNYIDILEDFSEVVRLSLRYCVGLKKLVIHTPFHLPGGTEGMLTSYNATAYANGFDILRWLPQPCEVVLASSRNPEIDAVVAKHMSLAKEQTEVAYAKRQLVSNEPVLTDH